VTEKSNARIIQFVAKTLLSLSKSRGPKNWTIRWRQFVDNVRKHVWTTVGLFVGCAMFRMALCETCFTVQLSKGFVRQLPLLQG